MKLFVDTDPNNYIAYFRRAAVYLGMGKSKAALPDLSQVIELKPDFLAVSFVEISINCLNFFVSILGSYATRKFTIKTRRFR